MAALSRGRPRPIRLATLLAHLPDLAAPFRRVATDALELVLPQRCPGCGWPASPEHALCESCLSAIPRIDRALCARCLLESREPHGCRRHPGMAVHAAWLFDARAQAFIHALKYGARPSLARGRGDSLLAALPESARRAELVLSMPHHRARLRERGVDASGALADALARALPAPRVLGALARVRATPPQAGRRERERRAAMTGAFFVIEPSAVAGRRVLLVDDVVTTGATFAASLEALREAGAEARGVALAWAP